MFRIDAMRLVGLQHDEGLLIGWLPDGIKIELSRPKVSYLASEHNQYLAFEIVVWSFS